MKALVLEKNAQIVYTHVPDPGNQWDNGVLVRIVATGICNSDIIRGFEGGTHHYPLIMGHEFSGIVEEGFSSQFPQGERVTAFPLIPCHQCQPCSTGEYAHCLNHDLLGSTRDGSFCEYLWVPEDNLFRIPDNTDIIHAAMTEPAAVALHGVRRLYIKPNSTAAVYGAGPLGNMIAQWMRIYGCTDIYIVDPESRKLQLAEEMGFIPVDASREDPVEKILRYTNGTGTSCTVEAVGLPLTYQQAIQTTARFGQVLFLGNIRGEFRFPEKDFSSILRKEITIRGTWNSNIMPRGKDDWSTVISYLDRELKVAPLISHTPELSEGPEIFRKMLNREEYFNKVVFVNK